MDGVVALTADQVQALTAAAAEATGGIGEGEVYYTYVEDGEEEEEQQLVENNGEEEEEEEHVLVNGTQEVLVFDEETGEYEKCMYIPDQGVADEEEGESVDNGQEESQHIDLQALLDSGSISAEEFATLTGQTVATLEDGDHMILEQQMEEEEGEGDYLLSDDNSVMQYIVQQEQQQPEEEDEEIAADENVNVDNVVLAATDQQHHQLSERYVVRCGKCSRTFRSRDFERHYNEVHRDSQDSRTCSICQKRLSKKEYLTHFKESHSDVRLGCPKCPQTYHSPELLNVHYKHFHLEREEEQQALPTGEISHQDDGQPPLKNARLLLQCKLCDVMVSNLPQHMAQRHPGGVFKRPSPVASRRSDSLASKPMLDCDVCLKSFATQRDFANHRRRKGFCRPPAAEEPPQKRRIGIIRKSL